MAFKKLKVKVGQVTGTHTNFPTLIQPSLITGLGSITLAEAQSARFYSDVGKTTEIAREIVSADEIHVKVTSMEALAEIWMDYDGIRSDYAVGDTYGRNNVWSGEKVVYHLDGLTDSTANGHTLTNTNTVTFGAGKIENSASSGTSNSNRDLNQSTEMINNSQFTAGWSVRSWVRFNTLPSTSDGDLRWLLYLVASGGASKRKEVGLAYKGFGSDKGFTVRLYGSSPTIIDTKIVTTVDTWVKYDVQYTGSNIEVYLDGTKVINQAYSWSDLGFNPHAKRFDIFGIETYGGGFSSSKVDEVRVRNSGSYSTDWITTEYNNQNANGSFWEATDAGGGGSTPAQAARRGAVMMM